MEENKEKIVKQIKDGKTKREKNLRKQTNKARQKFGTEAGEDTTKYGEFVCSYFAWVSLDEQKKKVKKLEEISKRSSH